MNIDTINNLSFFLIIGVEIFYAYRYMRYWLQLLEILKDDKDGSPLHSQKELNKTGVSGDFKQAYGMIFTNIATSGKILFSSNISNPRITALTKRIRRTVFLAVLTPLIIVLTLIFVTALMQ